MRILYGPTKGKTLRTWLKEESTQNVLSLYIKNEVVIVYITIFLIAMFLSNYTDASFVWLDQNKDPIQYCFD